MAIPDLLWACPACGTDAGLGAVRRRGAVCRECGATFTRTADARIAMTPAGATGRPVVKTAAEWTGELSAPFQHSIPASVPTATGAAESGVRLRIADVLLRTALQMTPLRHRGEYLGAIEELGAPKAGTLELTPERLIFTASDETKSWLLDDLTAVQPSSSSLQIKSRHRPVVSFRFPADSVRLWEELLIATLRERYLRAGRGVIVEFQPRIVVRPAAAPERARGDAVPSAATGPEVVRAVDATRRARPVQRQGSDPTRRMQAPRADFAYRAVQWTVTRAWRALAGLTVRGLEHVPEHGPFVLFANHLSILDPILVQAACPRPVHTMAKSTQFAAPVLGRIMTSLNAFPVRRYQIDPHAVRLVLRRLDEGHGVCVYPEGERSWDGHLQTFRLGTIRWILKAGAPVVPCAIRGTYEAWPRWERRPSFLPVQIRFGTPIRFPKLDDRAGRERALPHASQTLSDALRELLQQPS